MSSVLSKGLDYFTTVFHQKVFRNIFICHLEKSYRQRIAWYFVNLSRVGTEMFLFVEDFRSVKEFLSSLRIFPLKRHVRLAAHDNFQKRYPIGFKLNMGEGGVHILPLVYLPRTKA